MHEPAPVLAPLGRCRARRWTVRLLMLFYVLLLAEGPLRKWVLPGASNALVFVRDPVMVAVLLAYARLGVSPAMRRALWAYAAVLLAMLVCAAGQAATGAVPALAMLAGARNYFLFVPLAAAIADAFEVADYARWLRLNLVLAGPVGALVVAQYHAPPDAWINAAPGGDTDGVFLLAEDVVRPYGLFSFTLGHSAFAAWMAGVALAATVERRRFGFGPALLGCGGLGILAMGAFSGSRTYVLLAAAVLLAFLLVATVAGTSETRRKALATMAAVVLLCGGVALCVPDLPARLMDRQADAVSSEGATTDRVVRVATEFTGALDDVPTFGVGLGAGTNVANFLSNGRTDHVLAEYELTRIVQELGPYFGLGIIALRWGLAALLAAASLAAARRGNLQPACTLGFVAPVLLVHDVTLQNSMIGIAWFAVGIMLAGLRLGPAPASRATAVLPVWEAPSCA